MIWSAPRLQSGVSLIEVMMAVIVLSIGLLGVGTLMAVSLRNTQSSGYRTQAADLAYEFTDISRAYIADGSNSKAQLLRQGGFSAPNCNRAAAPAYNCGNDSSALVCDLARASERVCRALPDGRIRAAFAPVAGGGNRLALTVDVCWNDDRSQEAQQTPNCSSDSETMFRLVTEI